LCVCTHKSQRSAAIEVEGNERARVIAALRARSNKLFDLDFDQLPDPADHPAFRLEPIG